MRRTATVCLFMLAGLAGVWTVRESVGQDAAEGVRYAAEYYDNGQVKTRIDAGAVVPGEQSIRARKVRGECYTRDGKLDVVVLAEECEYRKDRLLVTSRSAVELKKDDLVITGTGLKWDGQKEMVEILSDVKLVFPRKGSVRSVLQRRAAGTAPNGRSVGGAEAKRKGTAGDE